MTDLLYQRVQASLARLKLGRIPDCLDRLAEDAAKHNWTYLDFLDRVAGRRSQRPP